MADNGNITAIGAGGAQNFNRSFTYDQLNRLATMTDAHTPNPCLGLSWTYDAWGNRTDQTVTNGTCNTSHVTANTQNRLIDPINNALQYDTAGNMTFDGSHHYTYDAENRLIQVDGTPGNCSTATACYLYDTNGRRVRKTAAGISTEYLYDLAGNVTAEISPTCSGVECLTVGYEYLGGQLVAEYKAGTTYFMHGDHLGSTRLVTAYPWVSQSQSVVQNLDYLPFGEIITTDSAISTHEFTGKERDSESGLDNFGARYMSSSMGRFMRPDDPNEDQDPADPQSWNLYSYVRNNPLNNTDPTGNACVSSDGGKAFHDDNSGGQSCKEAQEPQKVEVKEKAPPPTLPHLPMDTLTMLMCHNCPSPPFDKNQQQLGAPVGPIGPIGSLVTETAEELTVMARLSAILREAAAGKGNFGVGATTAAEAADAGEAWVGQGAKVASDGKTLVSADGLRQYRPPSLKPNLGKVQANFESRQIPSGQWQSNAHLDIK